MRCADLAERLTDLMEGDLEPDEEEAALEHLATCEHCDRVLADTREVARLAAEHGRPSLDEQDRARMLESIEATLERSSRT